MGTTNKDIQYTDIARMLIQQIHIGGNKNIIAILGFFIGLLKQGKLVDSYNLDSYSSAYDQVLNLDSFNVIRLNDVCDILPRKDNILSIVRTIGSISDLDHAKLFETIISIYASEEGKKQDGFYQPQEVTHFITNLLLKTGDIKSVYNPFAGIASYQLDNASTRYYSQEINRNTWVIGKIRLLLNDIESDFICEDSIDSWEGDKRKFNAVIATPPFGMRLRHMPDSLQYSLRFKHRDVDGMFLEKSLNSITENGTIISVIPMGFLWANHEQSFREYLVNNGFIQKIIVLPSNIFYNTSIPTAVIQLTRSPNEGIVMIDGGFLLKKEGRQNVLQYKKVLSAIDRLDPEITKVISGEEIAQNDYNLSPNLYLHDPVNTIDIPDGFELKKLKDLVSIYRGHRSWTGQIRLVRGKDLTDDRFSFDKTFEELQPEDVPQHCFVLDKDLLLISRIGKFNPTYFHYSSQFEVASNPNILAFEFNTDTIIPQYLVNELSKDYINQQLAIRSGRSSGIQSISSKHLLEIEVLVPVDLDTQKAVYENDKHNYSLLKARELGLEGLIAKMKSEYLDEIRMRKHDMKPYLRELRSAFKLMKHYADNSTKEIAVILNDLLDKQKTALDCLSSMIDRLADEDVFGIPERFNIDKYFHDLEVNHPSTSKFDIQCDIDISAMEEYGFIPTENLDFLNNSNEFLSNIRSSEVEFRDLYIKIAPNDFDILVSNIIANAEKHGFIDNSREDYEIQIDVSIDAKKDMFQIDFRNNGELLPKRMTKERFGLKGERAGTTGGTGIGGYRIKSIVKHYGGDYDIFCEPDKPMPVTIRIYLPILRDDEKI